MDFKKLNMPGGLRLRPAMPSDSPFLESLFKSTRDDLMSIDAEREFREALIDLQQRAQATGYGSQFPNAMYFIVEYIDTPIGKVTIDFEQNEIHLLDIAFIPDARNKGYGRSVMCMLQMTAEQVKAPVTLSVFQQNIGARKMYQQLGFMLKELTPPYEKLIWYPKVLRDSQHLNSA